MSPARIENTTYRIPGEEITWAGECPWTGDLAFGTESGKVICLKDLGQCQVKRLELAVAEEAINGVAFWNDFIGVSTRSEVSLFRRSPSGDEIGFVTGAPRGAHGILAAPRGRFLSPLGPDGILCIDAEQGPQARPWIDQARQAVLYYYKIIYSGHSAGKEILACAGRTDGLLRISFDKDQPQGRIVGFTSPDLDLIDVCSLASPEWPFAVAGLSLDRSLIFVRNILDDREPQRLRFEDIRGTPYSLLSAEGHLFVLTSKELVVLPGLASRFLKEERMDGPVHGRHSPVQAVEAFLARGTHLLIVMDDGVTALEIPRLVMSETAGWNDVEGVPQVISMPWVSLVA
jgi:hypothetical protein